MKTIAIPLLLATAAKAEANKASRNARMEMDFKQAGPVLIASTQHEAKCADSESVVAGLTAEVVALEGDLKQLLDEDSDLESAKTAVETMRGIRDAKVTALLLAETEGRDLIDADDTAQAAYLDAQVKWHKAVYAEAQATAAKEAADLVVTNLATETTAIGNLLTALNQAKTEAEGHHTAEETALGVIGVAEDGNDYTELEKAKFLAQKALDDKLEAINEAKADIAGNDGAGLKKTYETEEAKLALLRTDFATETIAVAEALAAKTSAEALDISFDGDWATNNHTWEAGDTGVAEGFFTDGQPTKAKALKDLLDAGNLDGGWQKNILDAENAWKAKADATVSTRKSYDTPTDGTAANDYTAFEEDYLCNDNVAYHFVHYKKGLSTDDANVTLAECVEICNYMKPWNTAPLDAPDGDEQSQSSFDWASGDAAVTTGDVNMCFGFQHQLNNCKLVSQATPIIGTDASGPTTCYVRNKTIAANLYETAVNESRLTGFGSLYVAIATAVTNNANERVNYDTADRDSLLAKQVDAMFSAVADHDDAGGAGYAGALANFVDKHTAANDKLVATTAEIDELEHAPGVGITGNDWYEADKAYTDANDELPGLTTAKTDADKAVADQKDEVATQLKIKDTAIAEQAAQQTLSDNRASQLVVTEADTAAGLASGLVTTTNEATGEALGVKDTKREEAEGTDDVPAGSKEAAKVVRQAVIDAGIALATARDNFEGAVVTLGGYEGDVQAKKEAITTKEAEELTAITACEATAYDAYAAALKGAKDLRAAKITQIEKLIDNAETNAPAAKAAGSRCELAPSNGTMRPGRFQGGENYVCGADLCCGAAVVPMPEQGTTTMTVETCQPIATETYSWQPPRAPLSTTWPDKISAPFACIDGAKRIAAAVSALAATVYMLA